MQEGRVLGARRACSSTLKGVFFNHERRVLVGWGLKTIYKKYVLSCIAMLFLCFSFCFSFCEWLTCLFQGVCG